MTYSDYDLQNILERQAWLEDECDAAQLELSNLYLNLQSSETRLKNALAENAQLKSTIAGLLGPVQPGNF